MNIDWYRHFGRIPPGREPEEEDKDIPKMEDIDFSKDWYTISMQYSAYDVEARKYVKSVISKLLQDITVGEFLEGFLSDQNVVSAPFEEIKKNKKAKEILPIAAMDFLFNIDLVIDEMIRKKVVYGSFFDMEMVYASQGYYKAISSGNYDEPDEPTPMDVRSSVVFTEESRYVRENSKKFLARFFIAASDYYFELRKDINSVNYGILAYMKKYPDVEEKHKEWQYGYHKFIIKNVLRKLGYREQITKEYRKWKCWGAPDDSHNGVSNPSSNQQVMSYMMDILDNKPRIELLAYCLDCIEANMQICIEIRHKTINSISFRRLKANLYPWEIRKNIEPDVSINDVSNLQYNRKLILIKALRGNGISLKGKNPNSLSTIIYDINKYFWEYFMIPDFLVKKDGHYRLNEKYTLVFKKEDLLPVVGTRRL